MASRGLSLQNSVIDENQKYDIGLTMSCCPVCARCCLPIVDRYFLSALGLSWHVDCLSCQHCLRPLDSQLTCFTRAGKIYCRDDYYRLFARQLCSRCMGPVTAHELVMCARQHVYHVDCFKCSVCQRRLTTGQHFGMQHDAIYCQEHYELVVNQSSPCDDVTNAPTTAVAPSEYPTNDEFNVLDIQQQQQPTASTVCSELVVQSAGSTGVDVSLSPPPAYTVLDGHHSNSIHQTAAPLTPPDAVTRRATSQSVAAPFYNGSGALQKGRPRKRCKISLHTECSPQPTSDSDHYNGSNFGDLSFSDIVGCDLDLLRHGGVSAYGRLKDGGLSVSGCGRQKRLRTSFKHHQLRSMKAYFALNHNPDAKDLKELAQKTGLTKRVLQVWFQNARAKYRRNSLKQEQQERTQTHQGAAQSDNTPTTTTQPKQPTVRPSSMPSHDGYPLGSRSPGSLSDVSSTLSSTTELLMAGQTVIDKNTVTVENMSLYQSATYSVSSLS